MVKHAYSDPFQAISDPHRRQMLLLLSKSSLPINALAENFDISRPAVSRHIKLLTSAGFVVIEDKGRERYCKLSQNGFNEVRDWMEYFHAFWNARLDALDEYLESTKP